VRRTPSAQTLVDMGVRKMSQELEEVPMTMIGGLDVHRQQITFDYVDSDGLVRWGPDPPGDEENIAGLVERALPRR
jgi:transposase